MLISITMAPVLFHRWLTAWIAVAFIRLWEWPGWLSHLLLRPPLATPSSASGRGSPVGWSR
jgi:hypothetical protein